jgi:hypothetical protein
MERAGVVGPTCDDRAVFETAAELASLQRLIDQSFDAASDHLKSIMTPERRLSAERLSVELPSPAVLNVATVTAGGEPRISALDGHFLHGHWYFSTAADSPKVRQLAARPGVSAAYTPRDGMGVFAHGRAVRLAAAGAEVAALSRHLVATYGQDPADWGIEIGYFRIEAHWLVGFAMTDADQAEIDALPRPTERPDPWAAG